MRLPEPLRHFLQNARLRPAILARLQLCKSQASSVTTTYFGNVVRFDQRRWNFAAVLWEILLVRGLPFRCNE
jgi:hypothetical protein